MRLLSAMIYRLFQFLEVLERLRGASAEGVLAGVWEDLQSFVAGAPQSDDITMLALRLKATG